MAEPTLQKPTRSEAEAVALLGDYRRSAWECLRFFLPLLKPHASRVILLCLVDLVQVLVAFIPPLIILRIVDEALIQRNFTLALELCLILFAVQGASQATLWLRQMMFTYLEVRVQFDLRQKLFAHLQRVSVAYAESSPVGQRVFRLRIDSDAVGSSVAGFYPAVVRFVEFLLILLAITTLDPLVTGISLAFLIPWAALLLMATSVYRVLDRKRLLLAEHRDAGLLQGVSSFELIKAFGRTHWELAKHGRRSIRTQRVANQHYTFWWLVDLLVVRLLPYGRTFSVTFLAYQKVIWGQLTLGQTVPMIAFVLRLGEPVTQLIEFINSLRRAMIPAERCIQILEVQSSVPEPEVPLPLPPITGHIQLEDVHFRHLDGTEALKGVTLTVLPGKITAIVGGSGAGKSTVAAMILRLHDPTEGRVLVEGLDLRLVNRHHLYRNFAVVTQEAFIMGGTLAENLRVARDEASDEQLLEALEKVGLLPWVSDLPKGLETDLESGGALSVGQKQRLGIARALLADPKVLVLDEPTSALDSQTEAEVMEAIWAAASGRTTLLITHRLNTIASADQVVVMDQGVVAEAGSFDVLASAGGVFSRLLETYLSRKT